MSCISVYRRWLGILFFERCVEKIFDTFNYWNIYIRYNISIQYVTYSKRNQKIKTANQNDIPPFTERSAYQNRFAVFCFHKFKNSKEETYISTKMILAKRLIIYTYIFRKIFHFNSYIIPYSIKRKIQP